MKSEEIDILVRHRLGQAKTAIEDAKFLIQGNRSQQSIINRSYYAMFYAVLALLQTIGKVPGKHAGVISLFDTEFVQKGLFSKELSKSLHKAFDMRQSSDYRTIDPATLEEARGILDKAADFVTNIFNYLEKK